VPKCGEKAESRGTLESVAGRLGLQHEEPVEECEDGAGVRPE
jgi:hypothetical protein